MLASGALTVPISCQVLPPLLVPITSEQVFVPHRAAPSTQPRWADTQVTELALNDAGTGVPGPVWPPGAPGAARAVPGRRTTAQVMAMAPAARTAEAVRLIHVLPCLGSGSAPVAPLETLIRPGRLRFGCVHGRREPGPSRSGRAPTVRAVTQAYLPHR